jgi:hypothetical protein
MVMSRLTFSRKESGLRAFVFFHIIAYLTIFTPVHRIVPGLSFSREEYRPVSLHPLPQHIMLDYIFRVLLTTSNACWSIFSPVYRIVLRLPDGLYLPPQALCVGLYSIYLCLQDCAEAEIQQGEVWSGVLYPLP